MKAASKTVSKVGEDIGTQMETYMRENGRMI